ncbi:MAG: PAS domain-containing protein [Pseudolabrys sp.]
MNFAVVRPDVIRAVNQSWLLNMWRRHRGYSPLPRWDTIEKENLTASAEQLSFLEVAATGDVTRFRIRSHGAVLGEVYGSPDCSGRFLDEIISPAQQTNALAPYRQVVEGKLPIYTIHDMRDRLGRLVNYERLLLPYSRDRRTVDRVLASFEFICADGTFERQGLMRSALVPPTLRLSATIQPSAAA